MTIPTTIVDTPERTRRAGVGDVLLDVRDLRTSFHTLDGTVNAVDGVSFSVRRGGRLAVVGESGSGKSVTALSIMQLIDTPPGEIIGGEILFDGKDLLKLTKDEMRAIRGAGHRHGVPGADDIAQSGPHRGRPDHRGGAPPPEGRQEGRPRGRAQRAQGCRRAGSQAPSHPVSARALGRHAPADHDRDGAVLWPEAHHRRRAHHRAGRDDPAPDPGAASRTSRSEPARPCS